MWRHWVGCQGMAVQGGETAAEAAVEAAQAAEPAGC